MRSFLRHGPARPGHPLEQRKGCPALARHDGLRTLLLAIFFLLTACAPVVMPAGPPVVPAAIVGTGDAITAADGTKLALRSWLPQGEPKAILIAVHGFNDYSYFFDRAGKWFAGQGVASYAYDQRGFGQSGQRGFWPGIDTLTQDLATAIRLMCSSSCRCRWCPGRSFAAAR